MCSQSDEKELVQTVKALCKGDLHTTVLFVASLSRSGERPNGLGGSGVGVEVCPGGKNKGFRSVLKSLKRLLRKCAEFSSVCFSLDMPSSCSCWSWPELHALISSRGVKKVKTADHVDATGVTTGCRIVLSDIPEVGCFERIFHDHAERRHECSLAKCIDEAWKRSASHIRSLVPAHAKTKDDVRGRQHEAKGCRYLGTCSGADSLSQPRNN